MAGSERRYFGTGNVRSRGCARYGVSFLCSPPRPPAPEEPFSFAGTPGVLPKDVLPHSYEIRIRPDLTALTTEGSERISIEVRKPVS